MHAEDRDPLDMGGTVTYKFVSTPGEKERFHVDPETGSITTADVSNILTKIIYENYDFLTNYLVNLDLDDCPNDFSIAPLTLKLAALFGDD